MHINVLFLNRIFELDLHARMVNVKVELGILLMVDHSASIYLAIFLPWTDPYLF